MARDRETLGAKVRRLERENRVWREREQDWEERSRGPADIEGYGNRVAVTIYLHKNLGEAKRIIDDVPNIPGLRPEGDPTGPPIGFRSAVNYVRGEGTKMLLGAILVGPYNTVMVRDRQRLEMWIYNRAGMLVRPHGDPIGESVRAGLHQVLLRVALPSVPYVFGSSQETEVQPVEAERKGFG